MSEELHAKCACGGVRAILKGPLSEPVACHCETCRRQSGHFAVVSIIPDEHITIKGEKLLTWYSAKPEAKRGFCSVCGSLMFWKKQDSKNTAVFMGCIDPPTGLSLKRHIFTEEKSDYYQID